MGLEVSRLARNNADWHRLLELCSFAGTLILDQDGLYDPSTFNDRLLLGLKGAMSEAELHILKSRLQEGMLNKARRGELKIPLPAGFEYDELGRVILTRDNQIQEVFKYFFSVFRRLRTASGTVKEIRKNGIKLPRACDITCRKQDKVIWGDITHSQTLRILHSPRYAGAFAFGRTRQRKNPDNKTKFMKLPEAEWISLIRDAHPGYITWEEYKANQLYLCRNAAAYEKKRDKIPPREGPALLQGIAICGKCGNTMSIRYHQRKQKIVTDYVCQREKIENGYGNNCQSITGWIVEKEIEKIILETVNTSNIETAVDIHKEMQKRTDEIDRQRRSHLDRCRYEAELARRRYMQIDPEKRYVAEVLEAEWNEKLRTVDKACEEYEAAKKKDADTVNNAGIENLQSKLADFSDIWKSPKLSNIDKKRIVRLIIEDVTIISDKEITCHIRFKGGATKSVLLPQVKPIWELFVTSPEVVRKIDELLDNHTYTEAADILNNSGYKTATEQRFDAVAIERIRQAYNIETLVKKKRKQELFSKSELIRKINISEVEYNKCRTEGWLKPAERIGGIFLYKVPDESIVKEIKIMLSKKYQRNFNII